MGTAPNDFASTAASADEPIRPSERFTESAVLEPPAGAPRRLVESRGVFGFDTGGMRGTMTVTDGSSRGFVRMVVYVHRIDGEVIAAPVRMETEVREPWIEAVTAESHDRNDEVLALLGALFEVAEAPAQRTVRISVPANDSF